MSMRRLMGRREIIVDRVRFLIDEHIFLLIRFRIFCCNERPRQVVAAAAVVEVEEEVRVAVEMQ